MLDERLLAATGSWVAMRLTAEHAVPENSGEHPVPDSAPGWRRD